MGNKGNWFSAIKKVFAHSSKEKVADGTEKKSSKEKKKKGLGKLKHGDSFIPLFREPSSIEKILGEAEREQQLLNLRPLTPPEQPNASSNVTPHPQRNAATLRASASPKAPTPPRAASPPRDAYKRSPPRTPSPPPQRVATPPPQRGAIPLQRVATPPLQRAATPPLQRVASAPANAANSVNANPVNVATQARAPSPRFVQRRRPEPTLAEQQLCATKIQAAYRGYTARRSYKALKGLVRLQGVVKGQSVKRQTANALKCMQVLVRVQNQIQSRRIQMLDNQARQRQVLYKNDKDLESAFSKWMSEHQDEWDDSTLTKEEIEARMRRKFDAIVRRERAMAYAYSHQSWKGTPRTAEAALMGIRAGGFPYWWNWLEPRQAPPMTPTKASQSPAVKSFQLTPTRPTIDFKASPLSHSSPFRQQGLTFDNMDTPTPGSIRSIITSRAKIARTPPARLQRKFTRGSAANSPFNGSAAFRDDDSLMSCPPFSVPRYMAPTHSAKAKVRPGKEPFPDSPVSTSDGSKRRVSFPLDNSSVASLKWSKGPSFSNKQSDSQKALGKTQSLQSVGNLSVDSTASMPVNLGRKPFNRFV
uniref:DUF4005 domain-containing protein n=1 Tax=Opuntia streptacantha TaxID=393608 RepID=A0A7C9AL75_OPUST